MRADLGARRRRAAVEADAGAARGAVGGDATGVGPEALRRVFRGDAALQGGAAQHDVLLVEPEVGECLARGDADLRLHEVDVGDLFGDGVLDLDAGVHLDEHVLARSFAGRVHEELDGARVDVADRFGEGDGVAMQGRAQFVGDVRRRRDLDDLLVAALHGAVPLEQVHGVAGRIGEDLHLDVARAHDGLLQEHSCVTEGSAGLAHRLGDGRRKPRGLLDAAHAASAAAGDGLHEDREPDIGSLRDELVDILRRLRRPQHRNSRGDGVVLGGDLVARHLERPRRRSDEGDAVLGRPCRELRILGEESVARVDGIRPGGECHADDLVDIEIGADRMARLADHVGLVGLLTVDRAAVLERVHRHGAGTEFVCGAERPNGDLATVRDQDLSEHAHLAGRSSSGG